METTRTAIDPEIEERVLSVYENLKAILRRDDLPPSVRANAVHALANVAMIVDDLALGYEMLYDLGV